MLSRTRHRSRARTASEAGDGGKAGVSSPGATRGVARAEFAVLRQVEAAWLSELPGEPPNQTLCDLDRTWPNWRRADAKAPTRKRFGPVQRPRFTLDQRREQERVVAGPAARAGSSTGSLR